MTERDFTVVVCGDDADGLRARALAHRWHAAGLIEDFGWVTPEDVSIPDHGPATVMTTVVGSDEQTELMALLGARPRTLIRIVVLHLLTHEQSSAERLVEACNHISGLVSRAMPRRVNDRAGSQPLRLLRINLLVPENDLLPQAVELVEPEWEINAVVSPEDRPDIDRMSIFVRHSVNLHGHGVAAAAGVGGLWADSPIGAFDAYETDSTTGGRQVRVIRCQARVVVGDDRTSDIADQVVSKVQDSASGAAQFVRWGVPATDPDAVVNSAVDKLAQHPEWAALQREPHPLQKEQVSLGTLLRNWALFQLQLPVAAFMFLLGLGRAAVEKSVTAATVGRHAGEEGRVKPLTPEQAQTVAEFRMKELARQLQPDRLAAEASRWGQTTPTAWRELRDLAIGLADGSPLPRRHTRAVRGGLEEVLAPHFVVPIPGGATTLSSGHTLSCIDVASVAEASEAIGTPTTDDGREATTTTNSSADDQASRPIGRHAQSLSPEGPDATNELAAWVEARKHSLLWRIASNVYQHQREEAARAERAEKTLTESQAPSTKRLRFAQLVVTVAWAVTFLAVVLAALWIWASVQDNPLAFLDRLPDVNWLNISRLVAVVLAILLLAGTFYFQSLRKYEWEVTQRLHALHEAGDEYATAKQQLQRWALMYTGLQDWGCILSELLHSPWARTRHEKAAVADYEDLPAAVAIATPVDDRAGTHPRVVNQGVEVACHRGWLAEEFAQMVTASPLNNPDAQPDGGHLPADLDLGLRAHGARAELVDVACAELTKAQAKENLIRDLRGRVADGDLVMPAQTVRRLGRYAAGDEVSDRDFFSGSNDIEAPFAVELFEPSAQVARYNNAERIFYCLPVGTAHPKPEQADVLYWGLSVASRVDVSPNMHPDSLTLFRRPERLHVEEVSAVDDFN